MKAEGEKSSQSLSQGFTKVQGSLLVLQGAMNSVISIMNTYERMQIRIQVAQDRVLDATERLRSAQEKLMQIQNDSRRDALNVEKAQRRLNKSKEEQQAIQEVIDDMDRRKIHTDSPRYLEFMDQLEEANIAVKEAELDLMDANEKQAGRGKETTDAMTQMEAAMRNLEIATAKAAKASNDVWQAWAQMGGQAAILLVSLPQLGTAFVGLGEIFSSLGFGTATLGLALGAVALLLAIIAGAIIDAIIIYKNWDAIIGNLTDAWLLFWDKLKMIWSWVEFYFVKTIEKIINLMQSAWGWMQRIAGGMPRGMTGVVTQGDPAPIGAFEITSEPRTDLRPGRTIVPPGTLAQPLDMAGISGRTFSEFPNTPSERSQILINIGNVNNMDEKKLSEMLYQRLKNTITS